MTHLYGNYQSDKYEFIPNIQIKYNLKTDTEIFEIEHNCAFINEIKTRIIPIQNNSRLSNNYIGVGINKNEINREKEKKWYLLKVIIIMELILEY